MGQFSKHLSVVLGCLAVVASAADLRPPAIPLVTHDPYFSIWAMSDRLTDGPTKHWTGATHSLSSLVRVDGTIYRIMGAEPRRSPVLDQKSVVVLPTHTRFAFEGAGIHVDLTFLTPSLPNDLEILSRPTTFLTWQVHSLDTHEHQVSIYFDAGSDIAVNSREQPVAWSRLQVGDLQVLRVGSEQQPVLQKSGDDLRIDWGYLYVVAPTEKGTTAITAVRTEAMQSFTATGSLPDSDDVKTFKPYAQPTPVLAETFDLGKIGTSAVSRHLVLAYDDEYSISYLERRLHPYWRRDGAGAGDLLRAALRDYDSLEERCTKFDQTLLTDLRAAGGDDYATLCALAYRQALAAHKLSADIDDTPMYFSKENFSNGSVDTVDVTYPSSPFFLLFNTRLLEAQLKPILDYAKLPRWRFPFAPHDLGRYPLADGQQYGGGEKTEENQMPVEESGNMLIMIAAMERVNGNARFADQYWPLLTKWAEYLRKAGLDPENQLCTDDFAGHLAHNANLSVKAIVALAAYGQMAGTLGHQEVMNEYLTLARDYAKRWVQMGAEGDHFRLAFDRHGTWSQKYNLVWDTLLDLRLFPKEVTEKELAFYNSHQNKYGLPLDNRADYTKIDWLAWTASLADSKAGFQRLFDPAYRFANESTSRVPLTDWYDTKTGKQQGFQARSVVGGIFIRMLDDPATWKRYAALNNSR